MPALTMECCYFIIQIVHRKKKLYFKNDEIKREINDKIRVVETLTAGKSCNQVHKSMRSGSSDPHTLHPLELPSSF